MTLHLHWNREKIERSRPELDSSVKDAGWSRILEREAIEVSHQHIRPQRLVVFVAGLRGLSPKWDSLRGQLAREPGYRPDDAHWLSFDHESMVLSFGSLRKVATKLAATIEAQWARVGGYDDVVLVAHSIGGPILRDAYVLKAGASLGGRAADWTQRVSRFVLFASVNRGIDTRRTWWLRPVAWLARHIPVLRRLRIVDAYRGSDFLTNLRINWIRHFGTLAEAQRQGQTWPDGRPKKLPKVIQVLGTEDGWVKSEDSKDVLAMPDAHEVLVPDADHADVYDVRGSAATTRYPLLRKAFCGQFSNGQPMKRPSNHVRRVVFLLHGIRASNVDAWITDIESQIITRDPQETIVKHPTYGYFSAARFALPSVRKRNIAMFQDWYTEVLAEYPTADYCVIAHSNGTYILGHSLLATPEMRFKYVALVGSVLPRRFWERFSGQRLRHQAGHIQNHRANRDVPVAFLCSALRGLLMRDIGTGGFDGFHGQSTAEVAYYQGGHSKALQPAYHESLVDFVFGLPVTRPTSLQNHPGVFRQLSNLAPYAAVTGALMVGLVLVWFVCVFDGTGTPWERLLWVLVASIGSYIVADVI